MHTGPSPSADSRPTCGFLSGLKAGSRFRMKRVARPHSRAMSGFTLLEMALALGILVLIVAMVAASRAGFQEEVAFRNTAADLSRAMHAARAAALQGQTRITMILTEDGAQWQGPEDAGPSGDNAGRGTVVLEDGIQWAAWDAQRQEWLPISERKWAFGSDGTVRADLLRFHRGKSSMDFSIDPLTAELEEVGFELH